jgi:hypothetical protein
MSKHKLFLLKLPFLTYLIVNDKTCSLSHVSSMGLLHLDTSSTLSHSVYSALFLLNVKWLVFVSRLGSETGHPVLIFYGLFQLLAEYFELGFTPMPLYSRERAPVNIW